MARHDPRAPALLALVLHRVGEERRPGCSFNQRFRCRACRQTFTPTTGTPFAGHRWPLPIITMAIRWYFRHRLSAADVRDLLAEREIDVSARTVLARAHKFGHSWPARLGATPGR
jgi:transposase-like protein